MKTKQTKQIEILLQKRRDILQQGISAYPTKSPKATHTIEQILSEFKKEWKGGKITLHGRLTQRRIMGKVSFCFLEDYTTGIQIFFKEENLIQGEENWYQTFFKKSIDVGDIVGVTGEIFTTKSGEDSLKVEKCTLLAKALKPLPQQKEVIRDGKKLFLYEVSNLETRYRNRSLDLILHPKVRNIFAIRSKITDFFRTFLNKIGLLEVETPILQPIYGGASALPFTTFHNKLKQNLFLRISNELYLKRLIVGGIPGVYEIAKVFRNEGMSNKHNPEFTLLEAYIPYQNYQFWMLETEKLLTGLVKEIHGTDQLIYQGEKINFKRPYKHYTFREALLHFGKLDIYKLNKQQVKERANQLGLAIEESWTRGRLIDLLFSVICEPNLKNPTFISHHPKDISPLAKSSAQNPNEAERFELFCCCKEIANCYSEQTDPVLQREAFEQEMKTAALGDEEAMILDEDFLSALMLGMPPTAGIGFGMDRITMLLTNQSSIQEVIFFPQMSSSLKGGV